MNGPHSMAEWLVLLPLQLFWPAATGQYGAGPAVLLALVGVIGQWSLVLIRWRRDERRTRLIPIFLVATLGFPLFNFLIMVKTFGNAASFPVVNQFLLVIQVYFSLSSLTFCEAYWKHRDQTAYATASLTMAMTILIWISTSFCYALTLQ